MDNEFSRIVDIAKISPKGLRLKETASADECAALTKRFDIRAVKSFTMQLEVSPWRKKGLRAVGQATAEIEQICGVTLDPMQSRIEEPLDIFLLPEHMTQPVEADENLDMPDSLVDGKADLGEIAVQCLSLAIDPYPRSQAAPLEHIESREVEDNPFAALKQLQEKPKD